MKNLYEVHYKDHSGVEGKLIKLYKSKAWAIKRAYQLTARPWCASASVLTINF